MSAPTGHPAVHAPTGNIHVEDHGTHLVVLLSGDIDATLRPEASEALLRTSTIDVPVAFDVTQVRTIDQSGVAFLWQAAEACAERGRVLTLLNPPVHLAEELAELHVSELFCVVRD